MGHYLKNQILRFGQYVTHFEGDIHICSRHRFSHVPCLLFYNIQVTNFPKIYLFFTPHR